MTKAEKRRRLAQIVARLKEIYPDAECALHYGGDPWKLLVMGRLSAQCTDERVNIVCKELFLKFPDAEAMANADLKDIEEIIKPCGLYRMKADNIKEASRKLFYEYGGVLPSSMQELLTFSGVGRKIANLLIGDIFGGDAIVCDTHCIRICGRLGMYPESERNPNKVEKILRELIDLSEGSDFCHRIVMFGRQICTARAPKCNDCPLRTVCYRAEREEKQRAKIKA